MITLVQQQALRAFALVNTIPQSPCPVKALGLDFVCLMAPSSDPRPPMVRFTSRHPSIRTAASGSKAIIGYTTLSMTAIYLEDLPEDVVRKLPKYPWVPATLLGRLAIHQDCRGQGLGGLLLVDAMKRSLRSEIAWVAFVVDAMDDQACAFYEHYGFARFRDMSSRMFLMEKTIEQAF